MAAGTCPGATAALDAPVEAAAMRRHWRRRREYCLTRLSGWRQAPSADNASAAAISEPVREGSVTHESA